MSSTSDTSRLLSPAYRWRFLAVLLFICTLSFADRAILSAVIEPIKAEFNLSDTQIGLLQGLSFALLYTVMGIPIGRLAERYNRLKILAVCVLIFSVATFTCGLAIGFFQLFVLRMMVGIGEGGFLPPTSSLVGDHYPASKRASALAVIMLGSPIGYLVGAAGGGWLASEFGWRAVFFAMGIPGLIGAVLLLVVLTEPTRGMADRFAAQPIPPPPFGDALKLAFSKSSYRNLIFAGSLTAFGMIAIAHFQFPFLMRVHGLSLAHAGLISGVLTSVSLALGTLIGGYGVDWANKFDRRWNMWLPAIGVTLGACAYAIGFLSPILGVSLAGVFAGNLLVFFYFSPTYATAQNLVGPRMRATIVARLGLFVGIAGSGLGPTYLGFASDQFAHIVFGGNFARECLGVQGGLSQSTCDLASAAGVKWALVSVCAAFPLAGFFYWRAATTLNAQMFSSKDTDGSRDS